MCSPESSTKPTFFRGSEVDSTSLEWPRYQGTIATTNHLAHVTAGSSQRARLHIRRHNWRHPVCWRTTTRAGYVLEKCRRRLRPAAFPLVELQLAFKLSVHIPLLFLNSHTFLFAPFFPPYPISLSTTPCFPRA